MFHLLHDFDRGIFHTQKGADDLRRQMMSLLDTPRATGPKWREDEEGYRLRMNTPGLTADEIDLRVDGDVLSLRGEHKRTLPEGYKVLRSERSALSFSTSFRLPRQADTDQVAASLKDGVLEVKVGRRGVAARRQIEVAAT